jgi:hypothetical protein
MSHYINYADFNKAHFEKGQLDEHVGAYIEHLIDEQQALDDEAYEANAAYMCEHDPIMDYAFNPEIWR